MFSKILIANRGEIACRVIHTARKMGIRTVAVYSDADREALHVKQADEAIHIGAAPSSESYLLTDRIIQAALTTGAQAIHPGYGFLSENAEFANKCAKNNVVFIGPPAKAIEAMGSKSAAKAIMQKAGVPLVPGYHGDDQNPDLLKQSADDMGYPVLLKAVAGGGGKGMRQVWKPEEFHAELLAAKRESLASFGNDDMLVEKYLTQPRHVEFQIFCDSLGNGVYLFERDCSVQRRHQKIIEEAPAPNLSQDLRQEMGAAAVQAAQAINYVGAGTVEFLLDVDGAFYFMEMNTRLQVEHPVTEMITGEDLVEWQFKIADGQALPKQQAQLTMHGHAFEARIYAEDPSNDFMPTTGVLETLHLPTLDAHTRIDTGVAQGDEVSPFYDPMISKLIVWDEDRDAALRRMSNALSEYHIGGVTTNIGFLRDLCQHPAFMQAELNTGFIENHQESLFQQQQIDLTTTLCKAGLFLMLEEINSAGDEPWSSRSAWRMNQVAEYSYHIVIEEQAHNVRIELHGDDFLIHAGETTLKATAKLVDNVLVSCLNGHRQQTRISHLRDHYLIFAESGTVRFELQKADFGDAAAENSDSAFVAPMNGTVIDVLVAAGDTVAADQALIIMEAMKMQHTIKAPSAGTVNELFCQKNDLVDGGTQLLDFTSKPDADPRG